MAYYAPVHERDELVRVALASRAERVVIPAAREVVHDSVPACVEHVVIGCATDPHLGHDLLGWEAKPRPPLAAAHECAFYESAELVPPPPRHCCRSGP